MIRNLLKFTVLTLFLLLATVSCSHTLVQDPVKRTDVQVSGHCSGSESVDDSTIAAIPVPIAAFFMPRVDVNEIRAEDYLKRCGDPSRVINRTVKVSRGWCIPTSLTYFITLGVWQWCPATVSWDADVLTQ